jgi:FkbM family methyltransferase
VVLLSKFKKICSGNDATIVPYSSLSWIVTACEQSAASGTGEAAGQAGVGSRGDFMETVLKGDFFRRFGQHGVKRYVLGINEFADNVSAHFDIHGFIDEFTPEKRYKGKPVVRITEVSKDAMVVSAVTSARPRTALERLRTHGLFDSIDYFSFADASGGLIEQLPAVSGMRIDFRENLAAYQRVRGLLVDQQSLKTFDQVLEFRLSGSLNALKEFDCVIDQQYFEPFISFQPGEIFVDGGGYDGFTTLEFVKRCPTFKSVHFFEPNLRNLALASEEMRAIGNIVYHECGLFDRKTVLKFDSDKGSGSRISETGADEVPVDTLDSAVAEKVSLIKLDLEGAEPKALLGMRRHILEDHPKIAVAVYHEPDHFRLIPEIILGFRKDYDLYLRHYTESWTETIMFFIPR